MRDRKAVVTFLGHASQLLDVYVSFSRQAAQAMLINTSKTIFPIQNTPKARFAPPEISLDPRVNNQQLNKDTNLNNQDQQTVVAAAENIKDTSALSYDTHRWTVNRSPFVHGRHQDQFELRTYKRSLELFDADSETIKRWLHYVASNMPAGVGFEYQIMEYEELK
jgi:small subunit ribosomal protein S10